MTDLERMTEELESLAKAKDGSADADALAKALESATAALTDVLSKSKCDDADDKKCDADTEEEEDDSSEKEDEEEEDRGEIKKSLDQTFGPDVADELVKSSEAFADLTDAILGQGQTIDGKIEGLQKSVNTLSKAFAALVPVVVQTLKSAELVKGLPVTPAASRLGVGAAPAEKPTLSKSLVSDLLTKAIQEKKVGQENAGYLSILTTRGADALPESLLRDIGAID